MNEEANLCDVELWHRRLGHISVHTMRDMVKSGLLPGINVEEINSFLCEPCLLGKQHRLPFKPSSGGTNLAGAKVYSDICGPMPTRSIKGRGIL